MEMLEGDKATEAPQQKQKLPDKTWKLADTSAVHIETALWNPDNGDRKKQQIRTEKGKIEGGRRPPYTRQRGICR